MLTIPDIYEKLNLLQPTEYLKLWEERIRTKTFIYETNRELIFKEKRLSGRTTNIIVKALYSSQTILEEEVILFQAFSLSDAQRITDIAKKYAKELGLPDNIFYSQHPPGKTISRIFQDHLLDIKN